MELSKVPKVVIITEQLIVSRVTKILDAHQASGYTLVACGGKGSRNVRSTSGSASVVDDFTNVQIEVIVNSRENALHLMNEITEKLFNNYSGITFLEEVEVLRRFKFNAE